MNNVPSTARRGRRSALPICAAVALFAGLVACSSSGSTTAGAVHPGGTASRSGTSAPPDPSARATSTDVRSASTASASASVGGSRGTTACALVTEKEAGVALGADPGPGLGLGHQSMHGGASSCIYGKSPTLVSVNLLPTGGRAAFVHIHAQAPAGRPVDVAAVGDGAFGVFTGPAAGIWFHKGNALVAVGVIVAGIATPPKDRAIALAKTAAGRL